MAKRAPSILSGFCPYQNKVTSIIIIYEETYDNHSSVPHYKVSEMECDYMEECSHYPGCPIASCAPKHPPGIGLG